jgi:LuxR family maltose regulon positive regulatory protein
VHEAVIFLLDHMPPQMHLVLLTRADPPIPLARLRARNQLTELRAADMRFTPDEAASFLTKEMGLDLSTEDIILLEERTEGWIAGLQLAALSLLGHNAVHISNFVASFTGSHHYIVDYLVDEVLDRQTEPMRSFMLQTSILERMTGPLCDALMEQTDGQATLEALERANLFVTALDNERNWYRYHPLFADMLRSRLRQANSNGFTDLHRRAAEWYARNKFLPEALNHALAAGDQEYAAFLVEQNALPMLLHGELTTLLGWLDKVEASSPRRPWLSIYLAWVFVHTGQQEKAAAILDQIEQKALLSVTPIDLQEMRGHIAAIRAHISAYRWDGAGAIAYSQQALELISETNLPIRSFVAQVLGGAYLLSGDLEGASQGLTKAAQIGKTAGNLHVAVLATFMLASLLADQGQLHQAVKNYSEAIQLATTPAGQMLPVAARAYNGLGRAYYEWNDLEAVSQYTNHCIALAQKWGNINALVSASVTMARVKQARGDLEGAQACLDEAEHLAHDHSLAPGAAGSVEIFQVGLWLASGNVDAALRWSHQCGYKINDKVPPLREAEYRTFARVLLAQNEYDAALALVNNLLPAAEAAGAVGAIIELLILHALILQAMKDLPRALAALKQALTLGQPEGYMRIFLDAGLPMSELLRRAGSQGIIPSYVAKLLFEFDRIPGSSIPARQPLIEPLSERELEVLRFIANGLSNQEIAQKLFIARGTVKAHTASIYRKLDIASRTQAVARARELNLI